ncbi:MAG: bifunctional transaldolase/phosoglucose isomerase, partial [Thaumarchaeota archaeon]|nr:bifunctional transaldolase/phosoglucose isomerase [Nitrososphaerota archaeon]
MSKIDEVNKLGQAIWLDYIRRSFITSGELQTLVDQGLSGVTSNPTIFEKAIAGSTDYDEDLKKLVADGRTPEEMLESIILDDIGRAADIFLPVYDRLEGRDGFVSVEVNPALANDSNRTVSEGLRFFRSLNRPNVMIKVPATTAGIQAVETLISEGVNVNVTLLFSVAHYESVAEAYISGLEKLASKGGDLRKVASVASFFVSRVDTAVDQALDSKNTTDLQGKIAIANVRIAYARFRELFKGSRWERLESQGARVQRPLWASTGTKNQAYPDTLYLDNIIGSDTVNTVPPTTLRAFLDHGTVGPALEDIDQLQDARSDISRLSALGIDLNVITQKLQDDGVASFLKSMVVVTDSISDKRDRLRKDWRHESATLGQYNNAVETALRNMTEKRIMHRIWNHDYTVWKPDPTEISNRLDWLHIAEMMTENIHRLTDFVEGVRSAGYTDAVLLGMGGSSLAPEVLAKTIGVADGYLKLSILDSTDPGAISVMSKLNPSKTLFIVSTKSGSTVETLSFFKFYYNKVVEAVGKDLAGDHFVAITDPGSQLSSLSEKYNFRATFLNNPNIGGRYSALSYFGLVPAALIGIDIQRLLDHAMTVMCGCDSCVDVDDNTGAWLGTIIGELAKLGRDKITFIISPKIESFGDWIEQLLAESTGKEGHALVPIVGEPLGLPQEYGDDRLFVYLNLENNDNLESYVGELEKLGHPVIRLRLRDPYEIGKQFFLWEMATAVAGYLIGINPFDQPNVESAKILAKKMVSDYISKGVLPDEKPSSVGDGINVYGGVEGETPSQSINSFLGRARPGSYISLQAYVQPTPETTIALLSLRQSLRAKTRLATTMGYGPRFLHSTGQMHKGDNGTGLFIQFTCDSPEDIPIPDEPGSSSSSISFGVLKSAESLGDRQALLDAGRSVIRYHIKGNVPDQIAQIV